jgi:hypothetical protein
MRYIDARSREFKAPGRQFCRNGMGGSTRIRAAAARGARSETGKQKSPGGFEASEANLWEWAFVTRSFPLAHAWTLSLSRAVCFPTPLSAACGCIGLMAGPFRPLPVGIFE